MQEKIEKFISDWGIIGGILKLLFGKMLTDSDGETLSTNRAFAMVAGIIGLITKDYVLIGLGVGQALAKTGVDALKKKES